MRRFLGVSAVAIIVYIAYFARIKSHLAPSREAPLPDVAQLLAARQRRRATAVPPAPTATPEAVAPAAAAVAPTAAVPSAAAAAKPVGSGLQMDFGDLGTIRLHLRKEWSPTSFEYATKVASKRESRSVRDDNLK